MREAVQIWLDSGAEVQAGLRLLSLYAHNPHLVRLITARPEIYKQLLIDKLCQLSGAQKKPETQSPKFRERWAFLSDPLCPTELKILAADKITTYHSYVDAHKKLFDCATTDACFLMAETLIKSFSENRKIHNEFAYYNEHHAVLGKHPIFKETQQLSTIRNLGIVGLIARRRNLEGAIWRIRHEIERGDKPHLNIPRNQRLYAKQRELEIVNKMIAEYESK